MCSLAILPPIIFFWNLAGGLFFEKSFFIILFSILTIVGIVIPYGFPKLPKEAKIIFIGVSGWFFSQLIYEFANVFVPEIELSEPSQMYVWIKYATCFTFGIGAIIVKKVIEQWKQQS